MPTFDASKAQWITKEVEFTREKVEVRARNTEKSAWRRKLNLRKTKAVAGLPGAIPGKLTWNGEHDIKFGWKGILPVPANGIGLHARADNGTYLICDTKQCAHGVAAAVSRKRYEDLKNEIVSDFGLQWYREDYIYGQFYRAQNGHTFVRLLPEPVDKFDASVIELLKARRMLASLPFIFDAMEILAERRNATDIAAVAALAVGAERKRERLLCGWRHAAAVARSNLNNMVSDIPGVKDIEKEFAPGGKADYKTIQSVLEKVKPDKGEKWSVDGVHKAAALVARAFYAVQGHCKRTFKDGYLAMIGIQCSTTKAKVGSGDVELYKWPVDTEGRGFFKDYLDAYMACRQMSDRSAKNGSVYIGKLAAMLARAVSDFEVIELFALNLAYSAFDLGFTVELKQEVERTVIPDMPSLKGQWKLVERVAQPMDDPDYPGFVVSVYCREANGQKDFILAAKGTSSEDAAGTPLEKRTRDQADKAARVSTGVEADADPAGIAYHAVKKYFKRVLLKRLNELGATPQSKFIVTGHSLGGALTERLHLKVYEAGFKNVWSVAFSPPALDARTISKALYKDEQMGPAAFEKMTAIGGTWDAVTKGGGTGACIPLRVLAIRPWAPGTFTPVPYSVAGESIGDQRFLQHGVMFVHECKFAGWAIKQTRSFANDVVVEDTDDTYMVFDYCRDVTGWFYEATRSPWGIEFALPPEEAEKNTRKEFAAKPSTDRARNETGSIAKYIKQVMVLSDSEAVKEEARKQIEADLAKAGIPHEIGVRFFWVKGAEDIAKKLKDGSSWATGVILNPGGNSKADEIKKAYDEIKGKLPIAEVQLGDVADKVADHRVVNKGATGYSDAFVWMATVMSV